MTKPRYVLIGAGGTGGHIIPAVLVGNQLVKDGFDPVIVGSGKPLDKLITGDIKTETVSSAPPSLNPLGMYRFFSKLKIGIAQSKALINKYKPVAIIGMGGFPSVPLVLAGRGRVPILLHEQNVVAGRANRFLSKYAEVVMVGFSKTENLPRTKIEVVGNPLRWSKVPEKTPQNFDHFGLSSEKKTVLIFGGSQGAKAINKGFFSLADSLIKREDLQWILITGNKKSNIIENEISNRGLTNVKVFEYITEMDKAYSICDTIIARAGAMTISEIQCLGIPSLLVPKKKSIYNHQLKNALYLQSTRNNIIVVDEDRISDELFDSIETLLSFKRFSPADCFHTQAQDAISDILKGIIRS
jgi:UDP-N-acetylglucosamine--N-acetylmuramyl-(pentapeptide) pyrophosphoryl-undecaprenol N-acetylglucosamine transferase